MKTNVAVIFGCRSVEHEISIISAVQAMAGFDREKYNVIPVYGTKNGEFLTGEGFDSIDTFKSEELIAKNGKKVVLTNEDGKVVLKFINGGLFKKKDIAVDVAFPIVHGTNCEDGTVQGMLEALNIPYVGCDVMSSALGMDKALFKNVLHDNGIPVVDGVTFTARMWAIDRESVMKKIADLHYPVIVKPVNLGSSIGISKADNDDELKTAVELACSFADRILVEHAVEHLREINCSVLGDRNDCEASPLEEPFMHDKILSFDDKYRAGAGKNGSKGMASLSRKLPADLPEDKALEIQNIAKETFKCIGASGVVRIDFLMDTANGNKVYVNEINTIPGSLSFYLWEAAGIKYKELIDRLISLAFKRQRERENLMFTVNTNILNESSSGSKSKVGKI